MGFRSGDSVEIISKEQGFLGSYFEATVIKPKGRNEYLVEYKTLLTDDEQEMLREVVDWSEVRPLPPKVQALGFRLQDEVDVFANDGWWVGKIVDKDRFWYSVYFESSGDTIWYKFSQLRVHQDWENGKWFLAPRTSSFTTREEEEHA